MQTKACHQGVSRLTSWLFVICIPLWAAGIHPARGVLYQEESTSTPTVEFTATVPTDETQPAIPTLAETGTTVPVPLTATTDLSPTSPSTSTVTLTPEVSTATTRESSPTESPVLPGQYVPDEILVRFKKNATDDKIDQCLSFVGGTILSSLDELNVQVVQVPFGDVSEVIASISTCAGVRYAEPNYIAFIADTIPSDPNWNLQYGLINIRAPGGWDYSTGSTAVTIAILDSGVDLGHPDLVSKIVPGYDFVNNDSTPQDDNGHGTHVAGIAAASANNGIGIVGVSWGAHIMPVKVLNAGGGGSFADVAAGIIWATDNGAQIINLSLGGASSSVVLQDAINYAYGKGVVLIAAAGNTGSGTILYPARYPNVIAVGAVDSSNVHAGFSNYGPELDVVAPGASIYSTVVGGYGYKSGTSMAAPYVAGLAAILRGFPMGYSPDGIAILMQSTALDLGTPGQDNLYGAGLIQMDSAIARAYVPSTATSSATSTVTSTSTPSPSSTNPSTSLIHSGGSSAGNQPGLPASPSTPLPTSTFTATQTSTLWPTPTISTTEEAQETKNPDVIALAVPPSERGYSISFFAVPCLGILFIVCGLWLFFVARQEIKRFAKAKRRF